MDDIVHVVGYHGTSRSAVQSILQDGFRASRKPEDWLGDGVYFFQDARERAWEWARKLHGDDAAVIGSWLRLDHCMDLLDIRYWHVIRAAYDDFMTQLRKTGQPLPIQAGGAHRLDRAVINYAVGVLAAQGVEIRAVRAAFMEGAPVFPGSALYDRSHIQIAIRDVSLIEESWLCQEEAESS